MQVSVEELDGLQRCMTVQLPAEKIDSEVHSRLQSMSRKARVDGFRPGKVPVKVVKRMFGPQIRQEVLGEFIQTSFQDAVQQENLRPAGMPKVEPMNLQEGEQFEYKATFEILPEFDAQGIDGQTISQPLVEITNADIDQMLERLRKQRVIWQDVERPSQLEDQVTMTFTGKVDGEDFAGNNGENVPFVLGSGVMVPGFDEQLTGQQVGQSLQFSLPFPEDHPNPQLAGKSVDFDVKIDGVAEPVLPDVDEEFAAGFGIEEGGVEELKKALKENMERELGEKIKADTKQQVMEKLLASNQFPVPQVMIDEEIKNLAQQANFDDSTASNSSTDDSSTDDSSTDDSSTDDSSTDDSSTDDSSTDDSSTGDVSDSDDGAETTQKQALKQTLFADEARRRVALGLIMSKVMTANDIEPDEARVQMQLEKMASGYEDSAEFIRWYRGNSQAMAGVRSLALEDQLVEWLLARAEVVTEPASFDDVMNPKAEDSKAA